jgi:acid phosphatase class B
MADKDKIDIKDVTGDVTGTFNPNTFKAGDDRFNPGNRIYVRSQTGYWQRVRKAMGWFFVALFVACPGCVMTAVRRCCSIWSTSSSTSSVPPSGRRI